MRAATSTERTLFKQFGSKEGLVTAVLDMVALVQLDRSLFAQLRDDPPATLDAFEDWHRALLGERMDAQAPRSDVGRLFLLEIIQNATFKERYSGAWIDKVWGPMVATFDALKRTGEIDADADTALLARSFLSLNVGYLVARLNIAPTLNWNTDRDAGQIARFFRRAIERR